MSSRNPAKCEPHAVFRFLLARRITSIEIFSQIKTVFGEGEQERVCLNGVGNLMEAEQMFMTNSGVEVLPF